MRAGEICGLKKQHVHEKHVHLPVTKNGSARDVPLGKRASELIENVLTHTSAEENVFGLSASVLDALFRRAKDRALVIGITFHDSRALALTRLSKKLNIMQLARVSGHRDLSILQNVYYRESVTDIAALLDRPNPLPPDETSAADQSEGDEETPSH